MICGEIVPKQRLLFNLRTGVWSQTQILDPSLPPSHLHIAAPLGRAVIIPTVWYGASFLNNLRMDLWALASSCE